MNMTIKKVWEISWNSLLSYLAMMTVLWLIISMGVFLGNQRTLKERFSPEPDPMPVLIDFYLWPIHMIKELSILGD
jgi:hypothetical protein